MAGRDGDMLVAACHAIKAADPTALVLTGGVYIYDGGCWSGLCDGMSFFNAAGGVFQQVPAALQASDVFSIHPDVQTVRPDDPGIPQIIPAKAEFAPRAAGSTASAVPMHRSGSRRW